MREENFVDQRSLSISDLQIDYLNLDNSVRNTEGEFFSQSRCSHCGGSCPTEKLSNQKRNDKVNNKSSLNSRNSNNKIILNVTVGN